MTYLFSGHAVGAAAQFNRLDDVQNLNHTIPTLGASVLPATGGVSQSEVTDYRYDVDHPRRRNLFAVARAAASASGKQCDGRYATEVKAELESAIFVEKLHLGLVRMHMLSLRDPASAEPEVSTLGSRIEGVKLGNIVAQIVLDDEPLTAAASEDRLAAFYRSQTAEYRRQFSWRFCTDPDAPEIAPQPDGYTFSLVREIRLSGPETELQAVSVNGYTITWKGFGRIILGEVHVKHHQRRITLVRLAMGSDAGGTASAGDGQTNGSTGG